MSVLTTLIVFNTSVLLANVLLASLFVYFYRDPLYRLSLLLWVSGFLNSMLQGLFQATPLQMILGYSTYFACSILLVKMLATAVDRPFPMRRYFTMMTVGLANSVAISIFAAESPFAVAAFPVAIGVTYPMIHAALRTLFVSGPSVGGFARVYAGILLVNGLHMLDYPFLRTNSEFALLGFSFALVILVGLSLVLPAFITKNVADRYSDRLADEVKSRTSDLQEANTHLKAVTAENKYLLSVVCHDLATPLATVVMGMDLLSETMEEEAKTTLGFDYIKRIRKALKSIEEILSYARDMQAMRTGKKKVSLEQVDLAGVVNESVSSLSEELGRKAINLKVENRSPESRVLADVSTLRNQVMNNLLSNAIKFSHPNGDIKLVIQETGDRVFLSVTDTGIGMPQDLASRVFSLSGVTNRLGTAGEKGTGFGLPIVKACLEQYGAEIRCESRSQAEYPDQHGTTFTVSFRKVIPSSVPSGVVA